MPGGWDHDANIQRPAKRPGLEDLQWADPESVALVEHLAENVGAERLLAALGGESGAGPCGAVESLSGAG